MGPQRLESVPEPAERGRGGKLCLGVTEQDSGEQSREGVGIEEDSGTRGLQRVNRWWGDTCPSLPIPQ